MRYIQQVAAGILVVLLSLILFISAGCNCQSDLTPSQATTPTGGKLFIWKVSSGTTHVYLLGSVHVASSDLYPLDAAIEDAFVSSDYLVVEVNTNNLTQSHATQLLLDYGTYPEGDGFKSHVSEVLYNKLDEYFSKYGMVMSLLNDFKPFVIYNLMSQYMLEGLGYEIEYGIDLYFMNKAEENNKDILELETPEFQMYLLSSVPDEDIIAAIQYDIDNPEIEKYLDDLFSAWGDGDTGRMETIVFEALVEEPDMEPYYEIMYNQRNLHMVGKIVEFLADDEVYFIVVGAGHLVGENGLVNLLQNMGYAVEQLDKGGN
ncbi:MAG: TraB/GumN family protein [Dehalococcoidales bacterium]|nr:TraB/GumN family protein [Dehalococcoidales bacterium]